MAKNTKAKAAKKAQRKSKRIHDDLRRQLEKKFQKVQSEKEMLESQNSDNEADPALQEKIARLRQSEQELRAEMEANGIDLESEMDVDEDQDRSDGEEEAAQFPAEPKLKQTKDKPSGGVNNTLVTLADLSLDGLDGAELQAWFIRLNRIYLIVRHGPDLFDTQQAPETYPPENLKKVQKASDPATRITEIKVPDSKGRRQECLYGLANIKGLDAVVFFGNSAYVRTEWVNIRADHRHLLTAGKSWETKGGLFQITKKKLGEQWIARVKQNQYHRGFFDGKEKPSPKYVSNPVSLGSSQRKEQWRSDRLSQNSTQGQTLDNPYGQDEHSQQTASYVQQATPNAKKKEQDERLPRRSTQDNDTDQKPELLSGFYKIWLRQKKLDPRTQSDELDINLLAELVVAAQVYARVAEEKGLPYVDDIDILPAE